MFRCVQKTRGLAWQDTYTQAGKKDWSKQEDKADGLPSGQSQKYTVQVDEYIQEDTQQ